MWNMFKVNKKDTRMTSMTSFWCLYCFLWTYSTLFSSVSIADVELAGICSDSVCKREYKRQIKSCFLEHSVPRVLWQRGLTCTNASQNSTVYLESYQVSITWSFFRIKVKGFYLLTIFAKKNPAYDFQDHSG